MQGSINFDGTLSGSIAGGGGGGSEVTITPILQSGTKIADFTIDEESGSLYAPTPQGGVSDVQINNSQEPNYESIVENNIAKLNLYPYLEKSAAGTMFELVNDEIIRVDGKVGDLEQIVPYKQDKLIAGNNITIDQDNVISASGGSLWNYSTTEVYTGQNWIDGKPIYCKVIDLGSDTSFNVGWSNLTTHNNYYDTIIDGKAIYSGGYVQQVGIAVNDTTYMELCAYYALSARYIIVVYTKK